jgi:uroporphyrinogen-III synthase
MSSPDLILITRPEPGASDTAARIAAMGLTPVIAPCLDVHTVQPSLPPPDRIAAVLMASGNAARSFPPAWHATPVLTVGDATARRAREAGFRTAISADGDAVALAALVRAQLRPDDGPLLLAAGEGQSLPLAAALRRDGFRVIRRVVYAARPAKALPEPARIALESGRTRAVLFFSAETARQFMRLVTWAGAGACLRTCEAITIGPRVAVALEGAGWSRIRVASGPNQADMLSMLR